MYSLIVSADKEAWEKPSFVLDTERFLEYTSDALKEQHSSLDARTREFLRRLPTVFAYERDVRKSARVGRVTSIETLGGLEGRLRLTFELDPVYKPIHPNRLEAITWDTFEMNRTHWAIKDGDLDAFAERQPGAAAPGTKIAEHAFSRQTLLKACEMFTVLTHAAFDRFLLEVGIDKLDAGRDGGRSLADRANALATFVIKNPSARAVEGELLSERAVQQAVDLVERAPDRARGAFETALERDGYAIQDGKLVTVTMATIKSIELTAEFGGSAPEMPGSPAVPRQPSVLEKSALPSGPKDVMSPTSTTRVFVVHGHDDAARESVARLVERLGFTAVVLHEQVNQGKTIIEKFEAHAEAASFAVVLLTPDDVGASAANPAQLQPRARQNVLLELGYFIGALGRSRVCALHKGNLELPSDYLGVLYVSIDSGGAWKLRLAQEMKAAGLPVDLNKI